MKFTRQAIDWAIRAAQQEQRSPVSPLGIEYHRCQPGAEKYISMIAPYIPWSAATYGKTGRTVDVKDGSFEDFLAMCREFTECCSYHQRIEMRLILKEARRQSEEMITEVESGKREISPFLFPLTKENWWGKSLLALAEAFQMDLNRPLPIAG